MSLALLAGALAVAAFIWPTWIESMVMLEPDGGSGEAEWLLAAAFAVVAVVLGLLGAKDIRLARHRAAETS